MTTENTCHFFKYGHCKFGVNCRRFHEKEVCENYYCESVKCSKRHPRKCKFYQEYRRCKFGDYCSYSHEVKELFPLNNMDDIKERLEALEKDVKVKEAEIKALKEEIVKTQKETNEWKSEFKVTIENITKAVLEQVTESLVNVVNKKQDEIEERNSAQLDSLHEQLTLLSSLLLPSSAADIPKSANQCPQPPQNQCDVCGKTFGSIRALGNHVKHDHKPKT